MACPPTNIPWLTFEAHAILPFFLLGLLWSRSIKPSQFAPLNTIVYQSLYGKKFHLASPLPPLNSFLGDPDFAPAFHDRTRFLQWCTAGVTTFQSFKEGHHFKSFLQLQVEHEFPPSELYRYTQIKHFYHSRGTLESRTHNTQYEHICTHSSRDKGVISKRYCLLNEFALEEKSKPMLSWERETGFTFVPPEWEEMLTNLFKNTRSHSICETAVKLHTRWYMTPTRIHLIYSAVSPLCFCGCNKLGSLTHTFWSCKLLKPIWQKAA